MAYRAGAHPDLSTRPNMLVHISTRLYTLWRNGAGHTNVQEQLGVCACVYVCVCVVSVCECVCVSVCVCVRV
jgi:hypothetical protein